MPDNQFRFGAILRAKELMKRELPLLLANQAQNYFVKSWADQGWDGVKWKEVKRRESGTPEYKYPKFRDLGRRTRAIMVGGVYNKKGEHLRNQVARSIQTVSFPLIRLAVYSPYAERHNDGLNGMPRRRFMGQTIKLTGMQRASIDKAIDKIFKA